MFFILWLHKWNEKNTQRYYAKDIDVVILIHNVMEYGDHYYRDIIAIL